MKIIKSALTWVPIVAVFLCATVSEHRGCGAMGRKIMKEIDNGGPAR